MKAARSAIIVLLCLLVVAVDSYVYFLSVLFDAALVGMLLAVIFGWKDRPRE